jgi:hypothetical protein
MSGDRLPKKVLDAVWVMPDHVGVSVLPWQRYVSGLLHQYSVGSDDAFDDVEKCRVSCPRAGLGHSQCI